MIPPFRTIRSSREVIRGCAVSSSLSTVVVLALAATVAACATWGGTDGNEPRQVIVDTDMGVDDIRALMLLIEHPDIEPILISVTGTGLGRCPQSAHNAIALLELLGAPDIPVGCGTNTPLEGFNTFPTDLRDDAVAMAGMSLHPEEADVPDAVALMDETLASAGEPVTLLTLGPLTNVAALLDQSEDLDKLDEIRMMGGAVDVGGNIISFSNFAAEFNIWIDPVAADRVFRSGLPMTLVPLDATNDVPLTPAFPLALDLLPDTTASMALAGNLAVGGPISGLYHWDDLAAVSLIDETVVTYETLGLTVDADSNSPQLGRTARDPDGASMQVAVGADRDQFEQYLFETITGSASATAGLWEPRSTIVFDGDECRYTGPDPIGVTVSAEVQNTSDEPGLGVVFGVYAEDATAADLQAMIDGGFRAPPVFFDVHTLASLPANTISYVGADGIPADTTIWCAVNGDVFELAGPKLRNP